MRQVAAPHVVVENRGHRGLTAGFGAVFLPF
jgi:hypothetical protein